MIAPVFISNNPDHYLSHLFLNIFGPTFPYYAKLMLREIEHHTINSVEDQISICHQCTGYKCNYNHFDAAIYQNINPDLATARMAATEETKNDCENESYSLNNATSNYYRRPPKFLETSFVLTLKQWNESKYDDTLDVGTIGQKVRKKWMEERGMKNNFSKRKTIVMNMTRVSSTNSSMSDHEAAIAIDNDRLSKNMSTSEYWNKYYVKNETFHMPS